MHVRKQTCRCLNTPPPDALVALVSLAVMTNTVQTLHTERDALTGLKHYVY